MIIKPAFLFICFFFSCVCISFGQNASGKYEGFAEIASFGKLPITAEIRQKPDRIDGEFVTPLGNSSIIEGSLSDKNLRLIIDADGSDIVLDGTLDEGKFRGKVTSETINGTFDLIRKGDASPEPDLTPRLTQSKEKWLEDLRFVAAELPKRHKNAFNYIARVQFENAVSDLEKQIPKMDDTQIVFGMSRLFSMIGDGHTALQWADAYDSVQVRFFWFGKELRVFRADKAFPRLNGARLMKIGGVKVEEIFRRSQAYIQQNESPQFLLAANAYRISFPAFLYALGVTRSINSATYEFIDAKGKRFAVELKTVPRDEKREWVYPPKNLPLWLQDRDKPLLYKHLPEAKTVYIKFQSYPRRKEFKKFSDELFSFLDKTEVKKIVFDMRLNEGGDFTRGQDYFIKPLKERSKLIEKGKLFVITGRWTYSAGMSNAAHFRNDLGAILVGEPTGARPNGYQEVRSYRLPNSRLEGSYSIELYKFADKDTAGLIPDKLIEPDWRSYRSGKDPALEWVLAYPNSK